MELKLSDKECDNVAKQLKEAVVKGAVFALDDKYSGAPWKVINGKHIVCFEVRDKVIEIETARKGKIKVTAEMPPVR